MFQLTQKEFYDLKSQFVTTDIIENKHDKSLRSQIVTTKSISMIRTLPYAFTEHGVVMLASLLRSDIAVTMSIQITRAFVAMRQTIATLASTEMKIELLNEKVERLNLYIEEVLRDQNDINEETNMQLQLINESLAELQAMPKPQPRRRIGFASEEE